MSVETGGEAVFPPRAYLIGAQKSGTTSLAGFLAQHPAICLSSPKEPDFFTRHWSRGLDWYRGCFRTGPGTRLLLDASQSYTTVPVRGAARPPAPVPQRIHDLRPDARLIYLLRDPVSRAYSSYWHNVRAGHETRPFAEAVTETSAYIQGSLYAAQLDRYLAVFPAESVLVLFMNEFTAAPLEATRTVLRFLDLDPAAAPLHDDRPRNRSYQYTPAGRLLRGAVGGNARFKRLSNRVRRVLPDAATQLMARFITRPIPPMTAAERALVAPMVADDQERLADLLGRPLPWRKEPLRAADTG